MTQLLAYAKENKPDLYEAMTYPGSNDYWCDDCMAHILPGRPGGFTAPHDRTYFAQHGEDCPFLHVVGL